MSNLSYIDAEKSISTGRLSFNRSAIDKFERITDTVVWAVLSLAIIFYPTVIYLKFDLDHAVGYILAFAIFPILIFFGVYGLYRKLSENRLMSIDTSSGKVKNKEQLLQFLNLNDFDKYIEDREVVIVNTEETLSFKNLWSRTITFIVDDSKIYFTMVKNYPIIDPPVFFSHLSLKVDLKKYFKDK